MPRVVARVNHPKNEWLFNENWGVDLSVSTPHLITALVEEAVSVGRLVRILQFEGGNVRLVEVTLAENAPVVDQARSETSTSPRRDDRRGRARRARRDAARRHRVRGRRRSARDGHERLRGRRAPDPHRRLTWHVLGRVQVAGAQEQLVHGVVHEGRAGRPFGDVLVATPSSRTRRPGERPANLRRPRNTAVIVPRPSFTDASSDVGTRPGDDAHRTHLARDPDRAAQLRPRRAASPPRSRAPRDELLAIELVDRLGQLLDEFPHWPRGDLHARVPRVAPPRMRQMAPVPRLFSTPSHAPVRRARWRSRRARGCGGGKHRRHAATAPTTRRRCSRSRPRC